MTLDSSNASTKSWWIWIGVSCFNRPLLYWLNFDTASNKHAAVGTDLQFSSSSLYAKIEQAEQQDRPSYFGERFLRQMHFSGHEHGPFRALYPSGSCNSVKPSRLFIYCPPVAWRRLASHDLQDGAEQRRGEIKERDFLVFLRREKIK